MGSWEVGKLGSWELINLGTWELGILGSWNLGILGTWELGKWGTWELATSRDTKNHATSLDKKKHATSWGKKITQPLGTKNHATSRSFMFPNGHKWSLKIDHKCNRMAVITRFNLGLIWSKIVKILTKKSSKDFN